MKLEMAIIFIISINMFLLFGQTASAEIAEEYGSIELKYYNYNNSILSTLDTGSYNVRAFNSSSDLGGGGSQVENENGNIFTDTFNALKSWLLDTTGVSYIIAFVNAFPNLIKSMGFPAIVAYSLGALWHFLLVFLVISWIAGRL